VSTSEQDQLARRVEQLEREVRERRDADAQLRLDAAVLAANAVALNARVDKAESRVGALIMVLVGFAFTVAGSALALALSLGSPS
jgi:hypothetical protein